MRRKEFLETQSTAIDSFLSESTYGTLGFAGERGVDLTPLNFVHERTEEGLRVYFHAARSGHRSRSLKRAPDAVFSVVREYALIPSYFTDEAMACNAGAFFKSVLMYGSVESVEDLTMKGRFLTLLMEKLQPEGRYSPVSHVEGEHSADYKKELKSVGVYALHVREVSAKFKFGQNQSREGLKKIADALTRRGRPGDLETIREIRRISLDSGD